MTQDNLTYIEDTVKQLIENGLKDLDTLADTAEEMEGDHKILALKLEAATKVGALIDRLLALEKLKKSANKNAPGGGNFNVQNAVIFSNQKDLLTELESTERGKQSLVDLNKNKVIDHDD